MPYVPNWSRNSIDYARIQQMQDDPEFQFYNFFGQIDRAIALFHLPKLTPLDELELLDVAGLKFPDMTAQIDTMRQRRYRELVRWNTGARVKGKL